MSIAFGIIICFYIFSKHKAKLDRSCPQMFVQSRTTIITTHLHIRTVRFFIFPTGTRLIFIRIGLPYRMATIVRLIFQLSFPLHILIKKQRLCCMGMTIGDNIGIVTILSHTQIRMLCFTHMFIVFRSERLKIFIREFLNNNGFTFFKQTVRSGITYRTLKHPIIPFCFFSHIVTQRIHFAYISLSGCIRVA